MESVTEMGVDFVAESVRFSQMLRAGSGLRSKLESAWSIASCFADSCQLSEPGAL